MIIDKKNNTITQEQQTKVRPYGQKYLEDNYKTFIFHVNKRKKALLIDYYTKQPNKTQFITDLIEKEMMAEGVIEPKDFIISENHILNCVVEFEFENSNISVKDYLLPHLREKKITMKEYSCQYISGSENTLTVSIDFPASYSLQGVCSKVARMTEELLRKEDNVILVQFGINPNDDILKKKIKVSSMSTR